MAHEESHWGAGLKKDPPTRTEVLREAATRIRHEASTSHAGNAFKEGMRYAADLIDPDKKS